MYKLWELIFLTYLEQVLAPSFFNVLKIDTFKFFLFFSLSELPAGFQFSDQGLNPCLLQWGPNHWTTKEFPEKIIFYECISLTRYLL